jgi:hypothetical protein
MGITRTESISERNNEENILTEQSICNRRAEKYLSVPSFVKSICIRDFPSKS